MQTCILTLGILLGTQISDPAGGRYPTVTPPATATTGSEGVGQQTAGQQPWSDESKAALPPGANHLPDSNPMATSPMKQGQPLVSPPSTSSAESSMPLRGMPSQGLTRVAKPVDLFRALAKPVGNEPLTGAQMTLAEAVSDSPSRVHQTNRVKLYWELSQAVTDFYLASLEELEIRSLRNGVGQAGQIWLTVQQSTRARTELARSAVEVAQVRLQKALGRPLDIDLPLPSDLPHCGAYQTKYEKIFRGRTSVEAEQLARLLPLRHQQLGQNATEATEAREWLTLVSRQRSVQSDGTQLLKAYENLALKRRAFVAAAYNYNADIARYTALAVPQQIDTGRLVAMLIQADGNLAASGQRGNIRRTSAEEAIENTEFNSPRTFASGRRNETRRVTPDEQSEERSILVPAKGTEP